MQKIENLKFDETIKEIFRCENRKELKQVLLGAYIPAGFPSPVMDYIENQVDLNEYLIENEIATFFVRVRGDSMEKFGIFDDDIMVIDKSREAKNESIIVAELDREFTVKQLILENDRAFLVSENESRKQIEVTNNETYSVWGVVCWVLHKVG